MMNAYEIKSRKSDYPYLVIAGQMTKAIDVFCRITEETEVAIESIKLLPYSCDRVFYREPIKNDTEKPNNRVVYTIFAAKSYIDLNVIKESEI